MKCRKEIQSLKDRVLELQSFEQNGRMEGISQL
jgi:hypothetical protein